MHIEVSHEQCDHIVVESLVSSLKLMIDKPDPHQSLDDSSLDILAMLTVIRYYTTESAYNNILSSIKRK